MNSTESQTLAAPKMPEVGARLAFPARREKVRAVWQPIYLEPMIGSGERICVGVAVSGQDGHRVVPISGLERFECLYGKAGSDFIRKIVEATCGSLKETLESSEAQEAFTDAAKWRKFWTPPLQGFSTGAPCLGAGDSLDEVARNGLMLCASLVEKAVDVSEENQAALTRTQFQRDVREVVVKKHPLLAHYFGRKRNLGDKVRPLTFGFVGQQLAANFAVLNHQSLSANVDYAKSQIWNLHNLQQQFQDDLFSFERSHFELLVQAPALDDASYSSSQLELIEEAQSLLRIVAEDSHVTLFSSDNVNAIADELMRAEAA